MIVFVQVVEGLMSSVYHACPQKITLQFDTFYMYAAIIALYSTLLSYTQLNCTLLYSFCNLLYSMVLCWIVEPGRYPTILSSAAGISSLC